MFPFLPATFSYSGVDLGKADRALGGFGQYILPKKRSARELNM